MFDVQEILCSVVEYFLLKFFHFISSQKSHLTNLVEGPLNVTVTAHKFTLALQMRIRVTKENIEQILLKSSSSNYCPYGLFLSTNVRVKSKVPRYNVFDLTKL